MKKIVLVLLITATIFAYLDGADTPNGYAGDPPRMRGCSHCHVGGASGSAAWFSVFPDYFVAGETYPVTAHLSHPSMDCWGFQLVVKDGANNVINTLSPIDGTTQVSSGGYINQTVSGAFSGTTDEVSWSFNWTAPGGDTGTCTFFASFAACDDDGDDSGDNCINIQRTSEFSTGINEKRPEPYTGRYNVYDISGRLIVTAHLEQIKQNLGQGIFLARPVDGNGKPKKIVNIK